MKNVYVRKNEFVMVKTCEITGQMINGKLLQCAIKKISKLEIDGIIMGTQNYDWLLTGLKRL